MTQEYDQVRMKSRLGRLPEVARVAFAAACSMRLTASYERYSAEVGSGDPRTLRDALDAVWNWVLGDRREATSYEAWIEKLTALLPEEDDAGAPPGAWAEDALASAIFALKSITEPSVQNAAWAAERAVNATSDFVRTEWMRTKGRLPTPSEGFADAAVANLLTQMSRDLQELEATSPGGMAAEAKRLRSRAATEPLLTA